MKICSFDGCDRQVAAFGLCHDHWRQQHRGKALKPINKKYKTADEKLAKRVRQENDCLVWTGAQVAGGYPMLKDNGVPILVHRYSYRRWKGPIPKGFVIHHRCRNPLCVNHEHLEAMSIADHVSLHKSKPTP
jgi:hypothetical protein